LALVQSNDLVVYEALKVRNLVKNRKLAKSISDASWYQFTEWLNYFAKIYRIVCVAVPPHFTSQDCSVCGTRVQKSLSTRTHQCPNCQTVLYQISKSMTDIHARMLAKPAFVVTRIKKNGIR
jgi:putative transposase